MSNIKKVDQEHNTALQINYTNNTDKVQRVYAFEIFNKNNDGIDIRTKDNITLEYLRRFYYKNPSCTYLIRLNSSSLFNINERNSKCMQSEKSIYLVKNNPTSYVEKKPIIIPFDNISPNQFQLSILDSMYSFVMDGISNDLEFDLLPNTSINIGIFFDYQLIGRNVSDLHELNNISENKNKENGILNRKYLTSIVIENNSDIPKDIILFDKKKYNDIYLKDESIHISDIFDVGYENIFNIISNKKYVFNSIRILSSRNENTIKQLLSPIEFNSGGKYYPAINITGNEFNLVVSDIDVIGEELYSENTMKVTVMPNTRVVYLFKDYKGKISNTTTSESFMNIDVENISDSEHIVDILSIVSDKNNEIKHNVFKNKMNLSYYDFKPDYMRIFFYNEKQFEEPIIISSTDDNGQNLTATIHPIDYININKFNTNFIDIQIPLNINKAIISVSLKNKGDGMNVVLFNSKNNLQYIPTNRFPIWVENTTDENLVFELPNNLEDYKGLPEGLKVIFGEDSTIENLIQSCDARNDVSLCLNKIYTLNGSQITQIIHNGIDLQTTNYFSVNQFNSHLLDIGMFSLLNFKKIHDSSENLVLENKQKVYTNILPKTKVAYLCSVMKNSYLSI